MQKKRFLETQGDAWHQRNRQALEDFSPETDSVVTELLQVANGFEGIGEVGCSYPTRLSWLAQKFNANGFGVDPSTEAIKQASEVFPALNLSVGTADSLPWADASVDVLVYGFCLYLCDREDLFMIACEGDRVLKDGGLLVVHDFITPFPLKVDFVHDKAVSTYKQDYSKLWTWNPVYFEVRRSVYDHCNPLDKTQSEYSINERMGTIILRKRSRESQVIA